MACGKFIDLSSREKLVYIAFHIARPLVDVYCRPYCSDISVVVDSLSMQVVLEINTASKFELIYSNKRHGTIPNPNLFI